MEFSKEQIQQIKKQLIEQIQTNFPEEKQQEYLSKIESLNKNQLIEFLRENNLINISENPKCIFCSIVLEEIPSTKIGENEKAIAILEINPISEGHSIIIPKEHISESEVIPEKAKELAEEISQKIAITFEPKKIEIIPGNMMGHSIFNVIPIYDNENTKTKRTKKTPEQLAEIKKKIEFSTNEQKKQTKENQEKKDSIIITKEDMILPKRIP